MLDHAPRFDLVFAEQLARDLYALDVRATSLTSERDQNFLLTSATGERIVLKIANALEEPSMIDAQQQAMTHLAAALDVVPRVIVATSGANVTEIIAPDGRSHLVWAVTYQPGVPLATSSRRTPALLEDFGSRIGALSLGLATFDHPALHRDFHWDLAQGRRVVAQHRSLIADASLGAEMDGLLATFDRDVAPLLPSLRRSALHNDLNDHNVLVGGGADLHSRNQQVVGIVDFGDMVHGYTVGDLAIAAAYVSLGSSDPLAAVANMVRGYHAVFPLSDDEISVLLGLVVLRLCTSAAIAAHQRAESPGNAYLDISQAAIRRTLPVLAAIPHGLATVVFREACGVEPVATSGRVRAWLRSNARTFAPVLGVGFSPEQSAVLDLSVGSPLVSGDSALNAEPIISPRISTAIGEQGARVGIGRYDEARLLNTAPYFASGPSADDEWRTVHIGLDLFADAGSTVHAPLPGTVHALADNRAHQDYGPVVVLRHATDDGAEFFTLYGHLSRESLDGLSVGQPITAGERIGTLGAPEVNGGWTPHLHLQVITDLLGLDTDFPGIVRASQRTVWRSLSPDPNLIVSIPADRFPAALSEKADSLARRRRYLGGNLSVAYRDPVRIVRGWRQFLFDDEGRRYLDAYNNVPHVGHSHPRVVRAAQEQLAVLNTNTRYLNDRLAEYAERLAATLPSPLEVCFFVSSASEANELAVRLARAHTRQRDMIVLDAAYHGNTTTLIDLSPYKHAGPGGEGAPAWVHVAPLPDDYRGAYRRDDPLAGDKYAADVAAMVRGLERDGRGLAGFIAETCPSVGGQLILPPGYLAKVYESVRSAGGICIADEVQTGLGRMGTHFWAFEAHGVVPDVVVMGKPLGNGHPLAALVTTREIADSFDNGMEYFSTFGGNNVSCAVGLAVLDVLRDDGLQDHALAVGERLLRGLRALAERHAVIGDVRGSGLFLGVELVREREARAPAGEAAAYVANRMRESGILLGTDGPHHNVVKIRPPMPFDGADADRLVESLDRILAEM